MAGSGTCTFHLAIMEDKGKLKKRKINIFSPGQCFQGEGSLLLSATEPMLAFSTRATIRHFAKEHHE